jgi:hypothetical protein
MTRDIAHGFERGFLWVWFVIFTLAILITVLQAI